jgi:hypothetical protein
MFARLLRTIRFAVGERKMSIASESPGHLELHCGSLSTVFDRGADAVFQNGKLVALMSLVESIELHRPQAQEGTVNWFIYLHGRGGRQVHVGQVTDSEDASIIGSRIATVTGRPVSIRS